MDYEQSTTHSHTCARGATNTYIPVVRQTQQSLELRLDLDDHHGKKGARQLHAAVGFGEALLLRRQGLDGVAELGGRGDGLQNQGHLCKIELQDTCT